MSLTTKDEKTIGKIVADIVNATKIELQAEIRHVGMQVEAVEDKADIGLGMLSANPATETIGKSNASRLDQVEANAKTLKSLVTLHDQQLRPHQTA